MKTIELSINQKVHRIEVDPEMPLLWAIRDIVGLKGTKFGCGQGLCGACTVQLDGQPIRSCQTPVGSITAKQKITTIEGASTRLEKIVQAAWIEHQVPQCGYCQSGQIMSATALLKSNPKPSESDIENYMSGNICRCGTYSRIKSAIQTAAKNASKNASKSTKS
ncbi:(2Fe-2S)-binding protein [Aquirufa antheringensis]